VGAGLVSRVNRVDGVAESLDSVRNDDVSGMEEVMATMRRRHWHIHRHAIVRDFRRAMRMWHRPREASRS
jgi:hypothetical protein